VEATKLKKHAANKRIKLAQIYPVLNLRREWRNTAKMLAKLSVAVIRLWRPVFARNWLPKAVLSNKPYARLAGEKPGHYGLWQGLSPSIQVSSVCAVYHLRLEGSSLVSKSPHDHISSTLYAVTLQATIVDHSPLNPYQ